MSNRQTDPLLRADWNKKNMKSIPVSFHQRTEKDILDWTLSQPNRSKYIKALIKTDMLNRQPLSKQIKLRHKILLTTNDAILLKTDPSLEDDQFTEAYRIIHGPNNGMTSRPYIILFMANEYEYIDKLAEQIAVKFAPDEFTDTQDVYTVPILDNTYHDNRIQWKVI